MEVFYRPQSDRILETERLFLEPIQPSHAAKLFDLLQHREMNFIEPPLSVAELEERYRRWSTHDLGDGSEVWLNWAARTKATNIYVGWFQATIHAITPTNISYVIFPPFWRQGFSTEGSREMISHVIEFYAPERFVAEMDVRNIASIAMAEKLGLVRCVDSKPGELCYELAARDWPSRKS